MIIAGCKQPCGRQWHWTLHLMGHIVVLGVAMEFTPKLHYDIMRVGVGPFMLELWVNHDIDSDNGGGSEGMEG